MGQETFESRLLSVQHNLLNFAYALTSNRDDAYDLLQDTTLMALDKQDTYIDNVNFKGWIFTIMRNLYINRYRRQMRSVVTIDQSDDLFRLNMSQDSGIETPEGAVNAKDIQKAMADFDPAYSEPFAMYIRGYHYAEIAEMMSLPLGTVKSRIHQVRKQLQKRLSDMRYD